MKRITRLAVLLALSPLSFSQTLGWGTVTDQTKISQTSGGFGGTLLDYGGFGTEVVAVGDLDGDGLPELAVSAPFRPGGAIGGSIWILFPNADGSLHAEQEIAPGVGGFVGPTHREFGRGLAAPGDLDGDGVPDLVASAPRGNLDGVLWILFLNPNGTVKSESQLSLPAAANQDLGMDMTCIGDLDGNGTLDLAATAPRYDAAGVASGAVYLLFLAPGGSLLSSVRIATGEGGFTALAKGFAKDVARLGDLDGNGVDDLVVQGEQTLGRERVWTLLLGPGGTVLGSTSFLFMQGVVAQGGLSALGDIDGDGVPDVMYGDLFGGKDDAGAAWAIRLTPSGGRGELREISSGVGGFPWALLSRGDFFGVSQAVLGDLNGDGTLELAIGANGDDDGGQNRGAVWITSIRDSHASTAARNPGGVNPDCFVSGTPATLGGTWSATVDTTGHPAGSLTAVVGTLGSANGPYFRGAKLFVDLTSFQVFSVIQASVGGVASYSAPIPNDPSLLGVLVYSQASIFGTNFDLCNALDLNVGF